MIGLLLAGCGNKLMPRPLSEEAPPQIANLQVSVKAKGVELSWALADPVPNRQEDEAYRISIQKTELKWENRGCLDCPAPPFQEVAHVDPARPAPAVADKDRFVWLDPSVTVQHAYRYQIFLVDRKGHQISSSRAVIAKVVPTPSAPRDLQAKTEPQGIILQWKPTTKDEQGKALQGDLEFIIERHAPGGSWEKVSPVAIRANTFMDPAVASAETYDYRVVPVLVFEGTAIAGEPAVVRLVKAPDALPPPPPKTVWVVPAKGSVEVRWTESEGKIGGYHVYRREGKEITRLTSNSVQHPPYVDATVKKNVVYYYAVSAVSARDDQREGLLSKWIEIRSLSFE
jgi:hypothetical protein